jgi:hypothetical protein
MTTQHLYNWSLLLSSSSLLFVVLLSIVSIGQSSSFVSPLTTINRSDLVILKRQRGSATTTTKVRKKFNAVTETRRRIPAEVGHQGSEVKERSFFLSQPTNQIRQRSCALSLSSSSSSNEDNNVESFDEYDGEEVLLVARLTVRDGVLVDDAVAAVSKFCQSYPFSVVLPVQPLMYLPTKAFENVLGSHDGVEIKFLRKKTQEKSSIDGGIRFFISTVVSNNNDDLDDDDDDDDEDGEIGEWKEDKSISTNKSETTTIEIVAKRNSKGQSISKIFAEKLVITSFVSSLSDTEITGVPKLGIPPNNLVTVGSIFHKWMDN